jgi:hypothetical protein
MSLPCGLKVTEASDDLGDVGGAVLVPEFPIKRA